MAKKAAQLTDNETIAEGSVESVSTTPEKTDRQLAEHAVRCLYGVGGPESVRRVDKFDEATIKAMAAAERENRRDRIPAIIAKAVPVKKA